MQEEGLIKMAEILIMNRDAINWKLDDIVTIKPDDWKWGSKELDKRHFIIVKLPGISADLIKSYSTAWRDIQNRNIERSLWRYDRTQEKFVNKNTGQEILLSVIG